MKEFITNFLGKKQSLYGDFNIVKKDRAILTEKQIRLMVQTAEKQNQIPRLKIKVGNFFIESVIKKAA